MLPQGCSWGGGPVGMLPATPQLCHVAFPAELKATLQQATPTNDGLEGETGVLSPARVGKKMQEERRRNGFRGRVGGALPSLCQVPSEAAGKGLYLPGWAL